MIKKFIPILFLTLLINFPTNSVILSHSKEEITLQSEAAILIDAKTGQILFEKYSKKKMYPASITKIVTGIIAIEQGNLNDIISISKKATEVDGTKVYLLENEKVELKRLVEGLLINSGNDAGTAIAEYFSGSELGFATKMNNFVKTQIGVTDSNFANPHGLFDENHYTTAYDVAMISQYAMNNDAFKEVVRTKELEWNGEGWQTKIYNHHRMLWDYEGVTGIKNGYVPQSGFTLVTSAERNGRELISVTLNASSSRHAYNDTALLLDFGFNNFSTMQLLTDKVYTDGDGERYKLDSEMFVSVPIDEEVSEEIHAGSLLIKGEDGTLIFELGLHKITDITEKGETKQLINEVKKQSKENHWILKIIQYLIPI